MAAILIRHKNVWNQPIRQSNASNRIQLRHLGTRAVFKISMPPSPLPQRYSQAGNPRKGRDKRRREGKGMGAGGAAELPARRSSEWSLVPLVRLVCMSNY